MTGSRLARWGLGAVLLLQVTGCGTIDELAAPLARHSPLTWPTDVPTPEPWFQFQEPGGVTPFVLPSPTPSPAPTATPPPPTPKPPPTPLPTATPVLSLEQLRSLPAPSTSVLGHGVRLPQGFKIDVFAQGLESASYMAYSPDGVLFVSLPGQGAVVALPDPQGSGRAASAPVYVQGLTQPSGIAFHGNYLYVAEAQQVVRFPYTPGQTRAQAAPDVIIRNLPGGARTSTHAIAFGPDERLYLTVASSCNACRESDARRAAILRYEPDGSQEQLFVQGIREAGDLAWYPNSPYPLVTNTSRSYMGDDLPPDTIELAYQDANFGWPFCHAGDIADPELGWPDACSAVPRPFAQLPAHTTPRGLVAYQGTQFPSEYYGSVFVALYGSWERSVPVGYEIVQLKIEKGQVAGVVPFASGWLGQEQFWGRPVDLIEAADGSLLVSDDFVGAIYRIHYSP